MVDNENVKIEIFYKNLFCYFPRKLEVFMELCKTAHAKVRHCFERQTEKIKNWLDKHLLIHKIIVIATHILRAAMMVGLMLLTPLPVLPAFFIGLGLSIGYRLFIEGNCPFKFSIPSCLGAGAYCLARPAIIGIITAVALTSIAAYALGVLAILPAVAYLVYVVVISSKEVEEYHQKRMASKPGQESCCCV